MSSRSPSPTNNVQDLALPVVLMLDKLAQLDAPTVARVMLAGGDALDRAILLAAQTLRRRETTTLDEICDDGPMQS